MLSSSAEIKYFYPAASYEKDERSGVVKIVEQAKKRIEKFIRKIYIMYIISIYLR